MIDTSVSRLASDGMSAHSDEVRGRYSRKEEKAAREEQSLLNSVCLYCRPDAEPSTPNWTRPSAQ